MLLGLATAAPDLDPHVFHGDKATLVAATLEICAVAGHAPDSGHSHEGSGCCCLQAAARRDATVFVAILVNLVDFAVPATPSLAVRSDAARRAGVALPTTPWLSRAPPSFS